MRKREFWQPAGREISLSLPTPPRFEICQTKRKIFSYSLLRTKIKNAKRRGRKISPSLTTTIWTGQNGWERSRATKKAANLFQTYCFRWPPVTAGIQFWKLISHWYDKRRVIALCFQKETIAPWIYPTKYAIAILIAIQHIHSISAITFFPVILFTDLP